MVVLAGSNELDYFGAYLGLWMRFDILVNSSLQLTNLGYLSGRSLIERCVA